MHRPAFRWLRTLAYVAALACTSIAQADVFTDGDQVMLQISPYVYHTSYDPEHNDNPQLIGVEWESASRWEIGASYFENTFYQPSVYLYVGKRWFLGSGSDGFFIKLTGGPLYGYKDEYEDKVPLNNNGLGLAVIPAIGYQYKRANAQLVILGTAAIMLTIGYDVWK
jgi:hypothetical protein